MTLLADAAALRPRARLDLVHPVLLLPGRARGRLLLHRHAAARWGRPADEPAARLGFYVAFVGIAALPGPADARPRPAAALLAHAREHDARRRRPELQVRVADVGRRLGARRVRRLRPRLVRRGARAGRQAPSRLAGRLSGLLDGVARQGRGTSSARCSASSSRATRASCSRSPTSRCGATPGRWAGCSSPPACRLGRAAAAADALPARSADSSRGVLELGGRLFAALEVLLLVVFVLTLIQDGALDEAFGMPWTLLWLVAVAGMTPAVGGLLRGRLRSGQHERSQPPGCPCGRRRPHWCSSACSRCGLR